MRNVAVLAGGTIMGQSIVVLASPLVTRLYRPEDFGILAVYTSIMGIISVIAGLRYETAIPLPEKDEDAANIVGLTICIVAAISLLTAVLIIVFGKHVAVLVKTPALKSYLWLLPLGVGMMGTYQVFNNWAVRKQAFRQIARTKINLGLGSVLVQLGLGIFKLRPLGLLIGQISGLVSGAYMLIALFWKHIGSAISSITIKRMIIMARRYVKFPTIAALAASVNSFTIFMPAIFLAAIYGPKVAGWFAVTQRVVGTPLNILSQSIAQVYVGKAAPLARTAPAELKRLFLKLYSRLLLIGLAILIPLVLILPRLFVFIFGSDWAESGAYLPRIAPFFITQFVAAPFGSTLDILERQGIFLTREIIRALVLICAFIIVHRLGSTARNAITIMSLAGTIGYLFYSGSILLAIKQHR